MTADFEKIKFDIKDKIILEYKFIDGNYNFFFNDYHIIFEGDSPCCNWPDVILKKKNIIYLEDDKKYNLGYIKKIKLESCKDTIERFDNNDKYKIIKSKEFEDGDYKTTNTFTLKFDNNKLIFFNGNNNGYYNFDLIIYKNKKLIFKSSL